MIPVVMPSRYSFPTLLSLLLAVLLAVAAAGALWIPTVYARETPLWAAQGRGQDWVDLVLVAPAIAVTASLARRGSRRAALLLAGTLIYAAYSFVLYAFFVHFGPLFFAYTAGLGLSFYAIVSLAAALQRDDVRGWFDARTSVGTTGAFTVLLGILFTLLWLSEAVPAVASGRLPQSAVDAGLITNPVHVLDLGIVLPAFVAGGVSLARKGALGYWLAPVMLAFGVVMDLALTGMVLSMRAENIAAGQPPLGVFVAMTLATGAVLWRYLRGLTRG
jgi:hypothetical protein